MPFLSSVYETFEELKKDLISKFGDHMSIHNAVQDAHQKVLDTASESFGLGVFANNKDGDEEETGDKKEEV